MYFVYLPEKASVLKIRSGKIISMNMQRPSIKITSPICLLFFFMSQLIQLPASAQPSNQPGVNVRFSFTNSINNRPVVLDSTTYLNHWNETFTVSRLMYYISNICLLTTDKKTIREKDSYHLINEEDSASRSFSMMMPPDQYTSVSFLIGVDSLKNVSGAQTGALDPLNGMFWTWNTGYIMFKMEGNSPQSSLTKHKIEYHIGGFAGLNSALRTVQLKFDGPGITITKDKIAEIIIQADLDDIWNVAHPVRIAETPACMMPGTFAAAIADNYARAFKIMSVVYP